MSKLTSKAIHGVYYQQVNNEGQGFNGNGSFTWLSDGRFQAEGLVIAAKDGVILTRRYMREVMHISVDPTC